MKAHAPGMMVTANVRLERPLGEGGMGSVWLADHLSLHSKVVVKFISDALATDEEVRARFSREAAAASQVRSPHVVQTFDHGVTSEGVPYIVMEYLEGRSLGTALTHEGTLPPKTVCEIVTQLARALEKAHGAGVVHRDIKPDNIFLCDAGDGEVFVKLLDFGIAKGAQLNTASGETKTGSVMGSPLYMSPEQLMGAKSMNFRTDLWSVGVVVFEALCGQRPFEGDTMGALTMRIHNQPHPIPSQVLPGSPPGLDLWFAKACALDPEQRFASAKAMADALAKCLTGVEWAPSIMPLPSGTIGLSRTLETAPTTLSTTGTSSKRGKTWVLLSLGASLVAGMTFALWPRPVQVRTETLQAPSAPQTAAASVPPAALSALPAAVSVAVEPSAVASVSAQASSTSKPALVKSTGPKLPASSTAHTTAPPIHEDGLK